MDRAEFLFPSFSGGLADGIGAETAGPNQLRVCNNVDFGRVTSNGITLNYPVRTIGMQPSNGPIGNVHWVINRDGYTAGSPWYYIILTEDGKIFLIDRYIVEVGGGGSAGQNLISRQAIADENKVYFVGGITPAVLELESITTRPMGFPSQPFRASVSASGSVDNGYHLYQIILTDENGHHSVPLSWEDRVEAYTSVGDGNTVTLLGNPYNPLPVCAGNKYIYRTKAKATPWRETDDDIFYYLVDTIGGSQTTFVDTDSDATIGVNKILDINDAVMPPQDLSRVVVFNGKMFGFTDNSSVLRYTPDFYYESWPEINAIPIGDPSALKSIVALGDKMILFKKAGIFAFWGSSLSNFDYRQVSHIYGTEYVDTIRAIDDRIVIFLDSEKRVILFDGSGFVDISKPIRIYNSSEYWARLIKGYYVLFGYDADNEIVGYAYHVQTGAWSKWTETNIKKFEIPEQPTSESFIFFDPENLVSIFGESIEPHYRQLEIRTHNLNCGNAQQGKSFKEIEIYFEYLRDAPFDGTLGQIEIIVDGEQDTEASYQWPVNFNTEEPRTLQKFRIPNGINGKRIAVRFVGNDNMKDFSLLQARVWYEIRGTAIR